MTASRNDRVSKAKALEYLESSRDGCLLLALASPLRIIAPVGLAPWLLKLMVTEIGLPVKKCQSK